MSQAEHIITRKQLMEEYGPAALPAFIVRDLQDNNTSLKDSPAVMKGFLESIVNRRYEEIRSYFSDDITSFQIQRVFNKLNKLISIAHKKEKPIAEKLAEICTRKVAEMFNIPEDALVIESNLVEEIPGTLQFHIKPDTDEELEYDSVESIENENSDIQKKRIINALMYGAAFRYAEEAMKELVGELFELDEDLPHLYSQIMKINDYLVFTNDVKIDDNNHKQGGYVETKLSDDVNCSRIKATGVLFPILLHETIKGVIEIVASYGLPDDKDSAERVINVSEALENDPWNMRLGVGLWDIVAEGADGVDTKDFPYFFADFVKIHSDKFLQLSKEIFARTRSGKAMLRKIKGESKYNHDFDDFKNDLADKQDKLLISDGYFTEEELTNDDWLY